MKTMPLATRRTAHIRPTAVATLTSAGAAVRNLACNANARTARTTPKTTYVIRYITCMLASCATISVTFSAILVAPG